MHSAVRSLIAAGATADDPQARLAGGSLAARTVALAEEWFMSLDQLNRAATCNRASPASLYTCSATAAADLASMR